MGLSIAAFEIFEVGCGLGGADVGVRGDHCRDAWDNHALLRFLGLGVIEAVEYLEFFKFCGGGDFMVNV